MDLAALAYLGAGALSSAASVYNNSRQIQFQREANDTQVTLANTAHQREVRDLIAAGLNPVLSASGSGASVPQLGTPSLENPARGVSDSIQSAAKLLALDIPLKESQAAVNSAQAENLRNQGILFRAQANAINSAESLGDSISEGAKSFGDWIGEKWSRLFGPDESVPDLSPRMTSEVLKMTPQEQDAYFRRLHKLRKERNIK